MTNGTSRNDEKQQKVYLKKFGESYSHVQDQPQVPSRRMRRAFKGYAISRDDQYIWSVMYGMRYCSYAQREAVAAKLMRVQDVRKQESRVLQRLLHPRRTPLTKARTR